MRKIAVAIFLLAGLATPVLAESNLTQEQLAERIYDLSHVKRLVNPDDQAQLHAPNWPIQSNNEIYIKIEGCTAQFRFFKGPTYDPYILYFEADISMSSLDFFRHPQTGDLYGYHEADQSWPPPSIYGVDNIAMLKFVLSGNNTFEAKIRSFAFFDIDDPIPIHELPMEDFVGNQVPYEMYGVKDEETVRQLVSTFQEYQQTYCLLGS